MRKLISAILISVCLSAYSEAKFADIKEEVNNWFQSVEPCSTISKNTSKTIDFPIQKYSINGTMAKGILSDGTIAKFYDTASLAPKLLLEGKVLYEAGRLVIEGIRYIDTSYGPAKIYGTFYVYNMGDFSMNYKPKKAGELRIKSSKASYLEGLYRERPAIVKMDATNIVYLGAKPEGNSLTSLSAPIPNITLNDDDSFDIYQILLQAKDNVTMYWANESVFNGSIKPTHIEDDLIVFLPLEGQKTEMAPDPKRITVSRKNGDIVYSQDYSDINHLLSNETLFVKDDGNISEFDYWNLKVILENHYIAKWKYRNGNTFEGTIKFVFTPNADSITSTISRTASKGIFRYPNGDRFEGDISTKSIGPFFVDGTTFFKDGSKAKGNWLEPFRLSNAQWEEVYQCPNPSAAKALAQKLVHSNNFPEYEYAERIEYFDPSDETQRNLWSSYIIFDKAKNRYICKYKKSKKTTLEFAVDKNGYRKWEVVYDNGIPTYINEFTWYSNGVIETIKSYSYNTKKLYLTCNFFSDGKLRSAYQYGRGNNGENVLRKSKESHPSYGGYTCKLYDLNGIYERSIEWNIGIGESLFGGRYDKEMAPSHLIFSKLKPYEEDKREEKYQEEAIEESDIEESDIEESDINYEF